jgi:uncharacterized protein (DUF1015 family)
MAVVAPFRGITYNFDKIPDIAGVLAPPYDVISDGDQEDYYQRNPYNVVRLALGKKKTGDSDWDNRYTRAADLFKRWESEEILIRSSFPSMYLTSIEYKSPDTGETRTRWGFIALVRIEEDDSSIILPHEKTFSFHREDRLKLMRACNAQISPVFGLYEDKGNVIAGTSTKMRDVRPTLSFRDREGCCCKMWEVHSSPIVKDIASKMSSESVVIADGHHRFEAARNFRNLMRARYGLHPSRAYEYVMMYLTNVADKGLTVLPYHRLFSSYPDFKLKKFLSSARTWFDILPFPFSPDNRQKVQRAFLDQLREHGQNKTALGFCHAGSRNYYLLCLKSGAKENLGNDLHPSLKKLDVLALSRLIFQRTLGIRRDELDDERMIQYESNTRRALSSVLSGEHQMVFLVNPTKIEQILEVTGNSLLMPRKSTYFHPKVVTGLVFNKIDPSEMIQVPGQ